MSCSLNRAKVQQESLCCTSGRVRKQGREAPAKGGKFGEKVRMSSSVEPRMAEGMNR